MEKLYSIEIQDISPRLSLETIGAYILTKDVDTPYRKYMKSNNDCLQWLLIILVILLVLHFSGIFSELFKKKEVEKETS